MVEPVEKSKPSVRNAMPPADIKVTNHFPSIWTRVYAIAITAVTNFMCPTIPKNGNDSSEKKNTIGLTNFHHIFAARFSTPPK